MTFIYTSQPIYVAPRPRVYTIDFVYVEKQRKPKQVCGYTGPSEEDIMTSPNLSVLQKDYLMNIHHNKEIYEAREEYKVRPVQKKQQKQQCNCDECRAERVAQAVIDILDSWY